MSIARKNLKGFVKREDKPLFHRVGLDRAVVALNTIIKPFLNLVDFTSPAHQQAGFILAGRDIVAVDSVSSAIMGLTPDSPDPECIMGYSGILNMLKLTGWQEEEYDRLIKDAAKTTNRVKRMAMYRQADRRLVDEQAALLPLTYTSSNELILCRPWVKNYQITPFGRELFQNVVVSPN